MKVHYSVLFKFRNLNGILNRGKDIEKQAITKYDGTPFFIYTSAYILIRAVTLTTFNSAINYFINNNRSAQHLVYVTACNYYLLFSTSVVKATHYTAKSVGVHFLVSARM